MPWLQRERHIATILRQFAPNLIIFELLVLALYELHMKTTTLCIISIPMCIISHQKHFETFNGCGAGDTLWLFAKFLKPKKRPKFEPNNFWRHFVMSFVIKTLYNYILADAAWNDLLDETIRTKKSVMTVKSYNGKTFFGLTVLTAVVWVNGQNFFFRVHRGLGKWK